VPLQMALTLEVAEFALIGQFPAKTWLLINSASMAGVVYWAKRHNVSRLVFRLIEIE
jgi:hypothetical protein